MKKNRKDEKVKKNKTLDNILTTVEQPPPAEAEEADQEQCGCNTNKKMRINENNFLHHSNRILQDLYMR